MKIPNCKYELLTDSVNVLIPITSSSNSKFRCKKREGFQGFGTTLAPSSNAIPEMAYMEWQIGFDVVAGDSSKVTKLKHLTYIGANGKTKHPYELAEIFYDLCNLGLITLDEVDDLISKIENMNISIQDDYSISSDVLENEVISDIEFNKSVITLPTFIKTNDSCAVIIEIITQKQQYASGVQPMLYLDIPVREFANSNDIVGRTSKITPYGVLNVNVDKTSLIKDIFLCFGLCSASHKHDILEILKLIKQDVFCNE